MRGKYDVYFVYNGSFMYRKIGIWNGMFFLILNWLSVLEYGIFLKFLILVCNEDC